MSNKKPIRTAMLIRNIRASQHRYRTGYSKVAYEGTLINPHFYVHRDANLKGQVYDEQGVKAIKKPDGTANTGSNGMDTITRNGRKLKKSPSLSSFLRKRR